MLEENLEHTFSQDPYRQMGGYVKRALGLNLYIKIENPSGQRIQELFVQGQPLEADQLYSAAFVTAQGVSEKYGISRRDLDIHAIEGLQHYLAKEKSVKADLPGTVRASECATLSGAVSFTSGSAQNFIFHRRWLIEKFCQHIAAFQ